MTFLAHALADRGHRVAHIVYDVGEPSPAAAHITLVARGTHLHRRGVTGAVLETARICRALWTADAAVTVVRSSSAALGLTGMFCRLRGRRLIFSSASNGDFTFETASSRRLRRRLSRLGVRLADVVVVQSEDQVELAGAAFGELRRVTRIPSFAEPAAVVSADARVLSLAGPCDRLQAARTIRGARADAARGALSHAGSARLVGRPAAIGRA